MTSLTAQVNHWKIATLVSISILVLVLLTCGYLILHRRKVIYDHTSADDVERNRTRIIVDATCARPFVISAENHIGVPTRAAQVVYITSHKPRRELSTIFEKIEGDESVDLGLRKDMPAGWFM